MTHPKTKCGIYAGTFDPITNGHEAVIKEAANMFKKIVVVVADNPIKQCLFTKLERVELVKSVCKKYKNVDVYDLNPSMLLEDSFVHMPSFDICLIRGVRLFKDFEDELFRYQYFHNKGVNTIFIPSPPNLQNVSSSFVRQFLNYLSYDKMKDFVDPVVFHMMKNKWLCKSIKTSYDKWFDYRFYKEIEEQCVDRFYHNVCHVSDMLDKLEEHIGLADKVKALRLAILFHDIDKSIKKSQDAFKKLPPFGNTALIPRVLELIEATNHEAHDKKLTGDEALIHDLDLMVLASTEYDTYSKLIRMEYNEYTDDEFNDGRFQFLDNMIKKDRIFILPEFEVYEKMARENINKEIECQYVFFLALI